GPGHLQPLKPPHLRRGIGVHVLDVLERNLEVAAERPKLVHAPDREHGRRTFNADLDHDREAIAALVPAQEPALDDGRSHGCERCVPQPCYRATPCPGCGQADTSTQGDSEMRTCPGWIRLALLIAFTLAMTGQARAAAEPEEHHAHMHQAAGASPRAPLFNNLGTYHRAITTKSPQAQRYFDQGVRLMWGFNLEEAQRSFEEASR